MDEMEMVKNEETEMVNEVEKTEVETVEAKEDEKWTAAGIAAAAGLGITVAVGAYTITKDFIIPVGIAAVKAISRGVKNLFSKKKVSEKDITDIPVEPVDNLDDEK